MGNQIRKSVIFLSFDTITTPSGGDVLYSRNTTTSGNIITHNIRTSMNEWTHFFIKIYLSHFILGRVDVGCVWEMNWRRGQTVILTQVLLTIAALLSPHLSWGCSTVGHWRPKALCLPLALASASCLQLTRTAPGTWLYYCLTTTCFHCSSAY